MLPSLLLRLTCLFLATYTLAQKEAGPVSCSPLCACGGCGCTQSALPPHSWWPRLMERVRGVPYTIGRYNEVRGGAAAAPEARACAVNEPATAHIARIWPAEGGERGLLTT